MTQAYIVTEGQNDQLILKTLLPSELIQEVEFINGGGKYGAQSMVGTLLATRQKPVILVVDADSTNPLRIQEQREFVADLYRSVAAGIPFETFPVAPQIEVVLFESKHLLERLGIPASEWATGKYHPKEIIQQALDQQGLSLSKVLASLSDEETNDLRKHPFITELIGFLSTLVATPQE